MGLTRVNRILALAGLVLAVAILSSCGSTSKSDDPSGPDADPAPKTQSPLQKPPSEPVLPPVSASTITGDIGEARMSSVDAKIVGDQFDVKLGISTGEKLFDDVSFFFDVKGSGDPDIVLTTGLSPVGRGYVFDRISTWNSVATVPVDCLDSEGSTRLKFDFRSDTYAVSVPLSCLGGQQRVRMSVVTGNVDPASNEYIGTQSYPGTKTFTGWIEPS